MQKEKVRWRLPIVIVIIGKSTFQSQTMGIFSIICHALEQDTQHFLSLLVTFTHQRVSWRNTPRKDPQLSCHELSWLTLIMKVVQRKRKPTILSSELILNADTFVQFFHQVWQHGQITITMPLIAWLTREYTPISAKQAFHFRSCWQHERRVMDSLMKSCCFGAKIGLVVISHWQERHNLCLLEFNEIIWPRSLVQWLTPWKVWTFRFCAKLLNNQSFLYILLEKCEIVALV